MWLFWECFCRKKTCHLNVYIPKVNLNPSSPTISSTASNSFSLSAKGLLPLYTAVLLILGFTAPYTPALLNKWILQYSNATAEIPKHLYTDPFNQNRNYPLGSIQILLVKKITFDTKIDFSNCCKLWFGYFTGTTYVLKYNTIIIFNGTFSFQWGEHICTPPRLNNYYA